MLHAFCNEAKSPMLNTVKAGIMGEHIACLACGFANESSNATNVSYRFCHEYYIVVWK